MRPFREHDPFFSGKAVQPRRICLYGFPFPGKESIVGKKNSLGRSHFSPVAARMPSCAMSHLHSEDPESLRRQLVLYRDLENNCPQLICRVDMDGWIIDANRSWKKTLGYENGTAQRLKFLDLILPPLRDDFQGISSPACSRTPGPRPSPPSSSPRPESRSRSRGNGFPSGSGAGPP